MCLFICTNCLDVWIDAHTHTLSCPGIVFSAEGNIFQLGLVRAFSKELGNMQSRKEQNLRGFN